MDLKQFRKLKSTVTEILERKEQTRNDDDLLVVLVYEAYRPGIICGSFAAVMVDRQEYGLPPFESVRRCRQQIQAERPDLMATDPTIARRRRQREVYKKFALEGGGK